MRAPPPMADALSSAPDRDHRPPSAATPADGALAASGRRVFEVEREGLAAVAARLDGAFAAGSRTLLLTGMRVTAQQMWGAVRDRARGRATFDPDPRIQGIMDEVPKATRSARAAQLGFPQSSDIQEIVREYEEAAVAHNG